eukprot:CAMPEP_0197182318 /NCGR_PEP_ID=MMETSP1423-20130617/6318_1 /TAXON_ID=476441 /ORGANISM="Pseudo-nitzschia heimii, Strain UNC1101" /LENGTH=315 /DNA_ID=CAMNT_0042632727 /DNA_START=93 /DNA_END=1040 /DNA_ORIENTATION=-
MSLVAAITDNGQCVGGTTSSGGANPQQQQCIDVGLSGVPETMLWTLHNRCSVASDPDRTWFVDDKAVGVYNAIDYDYERSFGTADSSHAIRSWVFDGGIRDFWESHPGGGGGGTIVNFAEGLETQRFRLADSRPEGWRWITVDLPSAIAARERFIQPDEGNLHVTASVLDTGEWMHLVPSDEPVMFTAQGLFMYLEEEDLRGLFQTLAEKYPSSTLWFDSIAKWLSALSLGPKGWKLTKDYTAPKLPFGANIDEAPDLFRSWVPNIEVEEVPWPMEKSSGFFFRYVAPLLTKLPVVWKYQPGMVFKVKFPPAAPE